MNTTNEEKVINSMLELLETNAETETEIKIIIKKIGLKEFFKQIDSLDLSDNIKETVIALKEAGDQYAKENHV